MIFCYLRPQSEGLYLGVWARVKRRLWRLMLRFISSFLNSSGEFRGDPRGEPLGDIFGDPPGEPALDRGMSWMMGSRLNLRSWGLSSTSACSSSELSERISLMVKRGRSAVRKSVPSLVLPGVTLVRSTLCCFFYFWFLKKHCMWHGLQKKFLLFQEKLVPLVQSTLTHLWTKPRLAHDSFENPKRALKTKKTMVSLSEFLFLDQPIN